MNNAMLICPRCRNAEYVSAKFVGKKFFCHKCGNLAVVVDAENLKKFDLSKLNISIEDDTKDQKYIVSEEENNNDASEALSKKYKETIINEINNNAEIETAEQKANREEKEEEQEPFKFENLFIYRFFNSMYASLRTGTQPSNVNDIITVCVRSSQYLLFVLSLFLFLSSCIFGWRSQNYAIVVVPMGIALLYFTGQYISISSLALLHSIKGKFYNKYTSDLPLKSFFILALIGIVVLVFSAINHMTRFEPISLWFCTISSGYSLAMGTLLAIFVLVVLMMCLVHPEELLQLKKEDTKRVSVEFISVCVILVTALARITPVFFFAFTLYVSVLLMYDCGMNVFNRNIVTYSFIDNKMIWSIATLLFVPLVLYYFSLFCYFVLDLCYLHIQRSTEGHKRSEGV